MLFVLINIVAIIVGLAVGGVAGFWIGSKWREDRRIMWSVAVAAFLAASILNFAGQFSGKEWLAIGALGLMGGIISGVKYGGFPEVRAWDEPPERPKQ